MSAFVRGRLLGGGGMLLLSGPFYSDLHCIRQVVLCTADKAPPCYDGALEHDLGEITNIRKLKKNNWNEKVMTLDLWASLKTPQIENMMGPLFL